MKKILLTLAAGLLFSAASFSQTHSDLSGNAPTTSEEGYMFKFKGTDENNCLNDHISGWAWPDTDPSPGIWSIDQSGDGLLQIVTDGTESPDYGGQGLLFYFGECEPNTGGMPIDLTNTAYRTMRMKLSSDVDVRLLITTWDVAGESNWNELPHGPNIVPIKAGDTDTTILLDFLKWDGTVDIINAAQVAGFGILPYHPTDYTGIAATVKFHFIQVGDAVTTDADPDPAPEPEPPVATNNPILDNSLISLYPNPAKDQVTVDLSALSGKNAKVKVMNAFGVVVAEENASSNRHVLSLSGFEKGIYLVQVTSENKVSSKKVVVE